MLHLKEHYGNGTVDKFDNCQYIIYQDGSYYMYGIKNGCYHDDGKSTEYEGEYWSITDLMNFIDFSMDITNTQLTVELYYVNIPEYLYSDLSYKMISKQLIGETKGAFGETKGGKKRLVSAWDNTDNFSSIAGLNKLISLTHDMKNEVENDKWNFL